MKSCVKGCVPSSCARVAMVGEAAMTEFAVKDTAAGSVVEDAGETERAASGEMLAPCCTWMVLLLLLLLPLLLLLLLRLLPNFCWCLHVEKIVAATSSEGVTEHLQDLSIHSKRVAGEFGGKWTDAAARQKRCSAHLVVV